jgi:hypothetical protein
MIIETKEVQGDVTVDKDTQFNHIHARIVVVKEGVMARLYGAVSNDIYLEKGSIVYMHGKISGKIHNDGGTLYLFKTSGEVDTL